MVIWRAVEIQATNVYKSWDNMGLKSEPKIAPSNVRQAWDSS
jgi:hypothetical protein